MAGTMRKTKAKTQVRQYFIDILFKFVAVLCTEKKNKEQGNKMNISILQGVAVRAFQEIERYPEIRTKLDALLAEVASDQDKVLVDCAARGLTNAEISTRTGLTIAVIQNHLFAITKERGLKGRKGIFERLGISLPDLSDFEDDSETDPDPLDLHPITQAREIYESMPPRERELVDCAASGRTIRDICKEFHWDQHKAITELQPVLMKFWVDTYMQLVERIQSVSGTIYARPVSQEEDHAVLVTA
jgi:DNA-binding CsgD family transcriptional regulator